MSIVGVEAKNTIIQDRVGVLSPGAVFRYIAAEKDPISEVPEVPHPEADALEDLRFVVAAVDEAVRGRPWSSESPETSCGTP